MDPVQNKPSFRQLHALDGDVLYFQIPRGLQTEILLLNVWKSVQEKIKIKRLYSNSRMSWQMELLLFSRFRPRNLQERPRNPEERPRNREESPVQSNSMLAVLQYFKK